MATLRIGRVRKSSPDTEFWVDADWVRQEGNTSVLGIWVKAGNGPNGTTGSSFGGEGYQNVHANGYVGEVRRNPFLPSGYAQGRERWSVYFEKRFTHDANGYLYDVGLQMELGYGSINDRGDNGRWHTGSIPAPPRIAPPVVDPPVYAPQAPTVLSSVDFTHNTFGVNYRTNGDGGAGIDAHEVEWWLSGGAERVWLDTGARGYSNPQGGAVPGAPSLIPGQTYSVRARVHNRVGWSGWSGWIDGTTHAAVRVKSGGSWRWAIPYVKQGGTWKRAVPFVKSGGSWRATR